jgi:hypothetical protein
MSHDSFAIIHYCREGIHVCRETIHRFPRQFRIPAKESGRLQNNPRLSRRNHDFSRKNPLFSRRNRRVPRTNLTPWRQTRVININ